MTDSITRIIGLLFFILLSTPLLIAGVKGTLKRYRVVNTALGLANTHKMNFIITLLFFPFLGLRYAYHHWTHWGGYYFALVVGLGVSITFIYFYLESLSGRTLDDLEG